MAEVNDTRFSQLEQLVKRLAATSGRLEKRRLIAELLRSLRPTEVAPSVLMLAGRIFAESDSKVLNIGYETVQKALALSQESPPSAGELTILEAYRRFEAISAVKGPSSNRIRQSLLKELFDLASPAERQTLLQAIFGEMRTGVSEGVMLEAIADAAGLGPEEVRAAHMFLGDLGRVAELALSQGLPGLQSVGLQLLSPVKPMLAELATDFDAVLAEHGGATGAEFKLDGARIQIHRSGESVRVFSRRLSDVTQSVPEVVEFALALPVKSLIAEGEAVAVDEDQHPRPFQDLMRRFRRIHGIDELRKEIPLRLYLFDLLLLDGKTLISLPYRERWARLEQLVPPALLVPRIVTSSPQEIESFLKQSLDAGHEGLMAKRLDAPYSAGKRGKNWFKIKAAETLDLVILAAEWGHGRRTGTLSNYWLGIRDGGNWQMIGKTFKGLTDQQRLDLMHRLLAVKTEEESWVVKVRPEIVVEVTYNQIQHSPRYESGFALRFARITRIRDDKGPADADTYQRLKALYDRQFERALPRAAP